MSKIKKLRENKCLTQKQVANILNIKQSTVSMWETGKSFPRTELLPRLAEILDCAINELFA